MTTETIAESAISDEGASAGAVAPGDQAALKSHYRSGVDDLSAEFFVPCLKEARVYRRAAGYFSSTALLTWWKRCPGSFGATT